jgi:hypothetical protein
MKTKKESLFEDFEEWQFKNSKKKKVQKKKKDSEFSSKELLRQSLQFPLIAGGLLVGTKLIKSLGN